MLAETVSVGLNVSHQEPMPKARSRNKKKRTGEAAAPAAAAADVSAALDSTMTGYTDIETSQHARVSLLGCQLEATKRELWAAIDPRTPAADLAILTNSNRCQDCSIARPATVGWQLLAAPVCLTLARRVAAWRARVLGYAVWLAGWECAFSYEL